MKLFCLFFLITFQAFADQTESKFEIGGLYKKNNIQVNDQHSPFIKKEDVHLQVSKNTPQSICGRADYSFYFGNSMNSTYLNTLGGKDIETYIKNERGSCTHLQKQITITKDSIVLEVEATIDYPSYSIPSPMSKLKVITEIRTVNEERFELSQSAQLFCNKDVLSVGRKCKNVYIPRFVEITASRQ